MCDQPPVPGFPFCKANLFVICEGVSEQLTESSKGDLFVTLALTCDTQCLSASRADRSCGTCLHLGRKARSDVLTRNVLKHRERGELRFETVGIH